MQLADQQSGSLGRRLLLPLAFFAIAVAALGTVWTLHRRDLELQELIRDRGDSVKRIVITAAETMRQPRSLERFVTSLQDNPDIASITLLVDQPLRVIASTSGTNPEQTIDRVDAPTLAVIRRTIESGSHYVADPDDTDLHTFTCRINVASIPTESSGAGRPGVLVAQINSGRIRHNMTIQSCFTIGGMVGMLILLGFLTYLLLQRMVLRPLSVILDVALRQGKGDRRAVTEIDSGDEVGLLARSLDNAFRVIHNEEQRNRSLIANIPGAAYRAKPDAARPLLFISDAAAALLDVHAQELITASEPLATFVHPDDSEQVLLRIERSIATATPYELEYRIQNEAGRTRWVLDRGCCIVSFDGEVQCLDGMMIDITEKRLTDDELRVERERLDMATAAAGIGVWEWDIASGTMTWDKRQCILYGILPERAPHTFSEWEALLHPGDLVRLRIELGEALRGTADLDLHHRIVHADESTHDLRSRGRIIRDESGRAIRAVGVTWDVTEVRNTERRRIERTEIASFTAEIATIVADRTSMAELLQSAAKAIVRQLNVGGASFWTLGNNGMPPQFRAADGVVVSPHVCDEGRCFGTSMIDLVAQSATGLRIDHMLNDPAIADASWLDAAEVASAAGCPLRIGTRVVGVVIVTSRAEIRDVALSALHAVSDVLALGIERREAEERAAIYAQRLERLNADLESQRHAAEAMNTELTTLAAGLEEARRAAEAATLAKSAFLANMSHEVRTPITAIIGFGELLLETGATSDQRRDAASTILRNSRHLLAVINDILDLSKVESGMMTIENVRVDVPDLLRDVLALVRERAKENCNTVTLSFEGPIPSEMNTDPVRLKQALVNIVGNAVKFTENGKVSVMVTCDLHKSCWTFTVRDSGIGMTESQMSRLFRPFSQADASTTRRFGGTGLGLVITQRIAKLLGGTVAVSSKPGHGSCFSLSIVAEVPESATMLEQPDCVATASLPSRRTSDGQSLSGRVLLVEDGPDNQRLIRHILQRAGATVEVAENGLIGMEAALAAVAEGRPFETILMDMQMPVMDGYTATAKLRERGYSGTIIAITAHAMSDDAGKCRDIGCNDYVAKPIDRDTLINAVRRSENSSAVSSRRSPSAI